MTLPRSNSNRLPHAGHNSGTVGPAGRPAALRLVPSYGHTTKFTYCRVRRSDRPVPAQKETSHGEPQMSAPYGY